MREPWLRHLLGHSDAPAVWLWPDGIDAWAVVIPP
jgi:hypothetical protein